MAVCAGGMAPFALVAGWRTFVHACGYLEGKGRTGQSILEAIALGAAVPIFILVPLVAVRLFDAPLQAAAYVLAYALIGAVVGFVFGAVLSVTALAVTSLASILSD